MARKCMLILRQNGKLKDVIFIGLALESSDGNSHKATRHRGLSGSHTLPKKIVLKGEIDEMENEKLFAVKRIHRHGKTCKHKRFYSIGRSCNSFA